MLTHSLHDTHHVSRAVTAAAGHLDDGRERLDDRGDVTRLSAAALPQLRSDGLEVAVPCVAGSAGQSRSHPCEITAKGAAGVCSEPCAAPSNPA